MEKESKAHIVFAVVISALFVVSLAVNIVILVVRSR